MVFSDYTPIMVCTQHMTFSPCRHHQLDSQCHYTSDGKVVEMVRRYQSSYKEENDD